MIKLESNAPADPGFAEMDATLVSHSSAENEEITKMKELLKRAFTEGYKQGAWMIDPHWSTEGYEEIIQGRFREWFDGSCENCREVSRLYRTKQGNKICKDCAVKLDKAVVVTAQNIKDSMVAMAKGGMTIKEAAQNVSTAMKNFPTSTVVGNKNSTEETPTRKPRTDQSMGELLARIGQLEKEQQNDEQKTSQKTRRHPSHDAQYSRR